mgnify:FL=1
MELDFQSFILADPALIVYLRKQRVDCQIHLSGEMGENNRKMLETFQNLDLKRMIFTERIR